MKKRLGFILFLVIFFPVNVFASDNRVYISCDKTEIKKEDEMQCRINASNLDFIVTSIAGQVELSDNLEAIFSSYNNDDWMMLDSEFDIADINLISENRELKKDILIAEFKIKAINEGEELGKISFKNVMFGDAEYENHEFEVDDVLVNLVYTNQNDEIIDTNQNDDINDNRPKDEITENPVTGNAYIFIILFVAILMLISMFFLKNKTNKEL